MVGSDVSAGKLAELVTHKQAEELQKVNGILDEIKQYNNRFKEMGMAKAWPLLVKEVKWFRVADSYHSRHKTVQWNTAQGTPSNSHSRVLAEVFTLKGSKCRQLHQVPPPGDLERKVQVWVDQNDPQPRRKRE